MLSHEQQQELRARCASVAFDVSMADYSTFRAGGSAWGLADVRERSQLASLLRYCKREAIDWRVIGRGSNILVRDTGFAGILFRLSGAFREIRLVHEEGIPVVTTGGGCLLAELLGWCRRHGLGGLEFLAGIPGSVGGAVRMNAGAFGHAVGEFLRSIVIIGGSGVPEEKKREELVLGYRDCTLGDRGWDRVILISAGFRLEKSGSERITEKMQEYLARRKQGQPLNAPSAGSFFKNPEGDYAGRLIESAGCKGARVGGALVSPVHANFIVNDSGEATATDILALKDRVQEKVRERTGILLEPEVHIF